MPAPAPGPYEDTRVAAGALVRDFDAAIRHHHADAEVDLVPARVDSMAGPDAIGIRDAYRFADARSPNAGV